MLDKAQIMSRPVWKKLIFRSISDRIKVRCYSFMSFDHIENISELKQFFVVWFGVKIIIHFD